MQVKNQAVYDSWKAAQGNDVMDIGAAIFRYAEQWANLMEQAMADDKPLADVWKDLSHTADTEGITGWMYGSAAKVLAVCWEHGDELRRLHNAHYDPKGDLDDKGIINPAIITGSFTDDLE